MQMFPMWVFHKTLEPKIIHSNEELKVLGNEWQDSPARFEAQAENPKEEKREARSVAASKGKKAASKPTEG